MPTLPSPRKTTPTSGMVEVVCSKMQPVLALYRRIPPSPFPCSAQDVLPEDHKIYADELPRETKRGKSASSGGGRSTNAWSGFGSSAGGGAGARGAGSSGGAAGRGRGRGMAVIGGVRRLNVTKQEALRSKGLFKIAPPSKVSSKEI